MTSWLVISAVVAAVVVVGVLLMLFFVPVILMVIGASLLWLGYWMDSSLGGWVMTVGGFVAFGALGSIPEIIKAGRYNGGG